jgi:hypothetical protein
VKPNALRQLRALVLKDLRLELRTRQTLLAMALFALSVMLIFEFAVGSRTDDLTPFAGGVLWATLALTAVLAVGRTWVPEREQRVLDGLLVAPVPRLALLASRIIAIAAYMVVVELLAVPLALLLFVGLHYYLVRVKGISMPFWLRPSGRKAPFTDHIKIWLIYGGVAMVILLGFALFIHRDPGTAPQLLSSSPLFNSPDDPGGLGYTPSFPISWTRGMNIIVANMGMDPDIWGTVIGMVLMFGALLVIPFLDRGDLEPQGWAAAFSLRKRGWAFLAMAIFWAVLVFGMIASAITGAG